MQNSFKFIPLALFILLGFTSDLHAQNNKQSKEKALINNVLDLFHQSASNANAETYFSQLSQNAIFIGTDPKETWTLKEFKNFARPYFLKGQGWTYIPRDRHIYFSINQQTAWFDEMLDNKKYGETRGTGVLIKTAQGWKIAQYHLTLPIPNAITADVVKLIQANAK